jgi:hypothetical protein
MSVYLQIGDNEPMSLASNKGWGDVCRAVESSADLPIMKKLVEQGRVDESNGIADEIAELLATDLDSSVKETLGAMKESLDGESGPIGIV